MSQMAGNETRQTRVSSRKIHRISGVEIGGRPKIGFRNYNQLQCVFEHHITIRSVHKPTSKL